MDKLVSITKNITKTITKQVTNGVTKDVLVNLKSRYLQFLSYVKKDGTVHDIVGTAEGSFKNVPVVYFNGTTDSLFTNISGDTTIAKYEGTSVLTLNGNIIEATEGHLWYLELSNGEVYHLNEDSGDICFCVNESSFMILSGGEAQRARIDDIPNSNQYGGFSTGLDIFGIGYYIAPVQVSKDYLSSFSILDFLLRHFIQKGNRFLFADKSKIELNLENNNTVTSVGKTVAELVSLYDLALTREGYYAEGSNSSYQTKISDMQVIEDDGGTRAAIFDNLTSKLEFQPQTLTDFSFVFIYDTDSTAANASEYKILIGNGNGANSLIKLLTGFSIKFYTQNGDIFSLDIASVNCNMVYTITVEGQILKLYANDNLTNTVDMNGLHTTVTFSTTDSANTDEKLSGKLAKYQLYDYALSAEQVIDKNLITESPLMDIKGVYDSVDYSGNGNFVKLTDVTFARCGDPSYETLPKTLMPLPCQYDGEVNDYIYIKNGRVYFINPTSDIALLFDRSNAALFNDSARGFGYDSVNPTSWHINEFRQSIIDLWSDVTHVGAIAIDPAETIYKFTDIKSIEGFSVAALAGLLFNIVNNSQYIPLIF